MAWQHLETYKDGQTGIFWFDTGLASYAAFGELWRSPMSNDPPGIRCVWWDDVGYGPEDEITHWMPCDSPRPILQ